jgi:hypothetical protein
MMDPSKSVIRGTMGVGAPVLLSSGFSLRQVSASTEFPGALGYQIYRSSDTPKLDSTKNAPTDTDSIGSLAETPGVGWIGRNIMLLAYAGGDTV